VMWSLHIKLLLADRESTTLYNYQLSAEGQLSVAVLASILFCCSALTGTMLGDTSTLMIPTYEALLGALLLMAGIPVLTAADAAQSGGQVVFTREGEGEAAEVSHSCQPALRGPIV